MRKGTAQASFRTAWRGLRELCEEATAKGSTEFVFKGRRSVTNQSKLIMEKNQFVEQVLKAHKKVVDDAWEKWQEAMGEDIKLLDAGKESELEKKYPNGFKDFLLEFLDVLIKENEEQTA